MSSGCAGVFQHIPSSGVKSGKSCQPYAILCYMSAQPDEPKSFDIRAEWETDSRSVPAVVNQAILRPGIDGNDGSMQGVYLQLGHVNPPLDEPHDGMTLPIVQLGHFFITEGALRQLAENCSAALADLDAQRGRTKGQ